MKILLVGGGSGGHITPVLAVASELKNIDPKITTIYVGQKGDHLNDVIKKDTSIDKNYTVMAGKYRRYNGGLLSQLLDVPTLLKNARDVIYLGIGLIQSSILIAKLRPDVVFSRGSFVAVPVSLAAKIFRVPYVTHDSDPVPSLSNRMLSKWAAYHLTALDEENYPYPRENTINTGIPLSNKFVQVDEKLKNKYRKELDIPEKSKVLLVTGGGLGAEEINQAMSEIEGHLLEQFRDLHIINIVGQKNLEKYQDFYTELKRDFNERLKVIGFTDQVYLYSGAADLIIARAGATNLAEFAVQNKACIIIPGSHLTGGHQIENAKILAEKEAIVPIYSKGMKLDSNKLAQKIVDLLKDSKGRGVLEKNISMFAKPNAGNTIAKLLIKIGENEA